ncbi:MAG: hypothetical protein KJZ65_04305 [Phycisphaerales bacterium]|nr:hypothetical protein [Phycisphaerales bacterium]
MRGKHLTRVIAFACVMTPASWAMAQNQRGPGPQQQADQPETLRDRLRMRIDRTRESLDRLEKLLNRVEAGEEIDPAELVDVVPERPLRDRLGEREPGERRFGPGGPGGSGGEFIPGGQGLGPGGPPGMGRVETAPVPAPEEVAAFIEAELPWLNERLRRADAEREGMGQEILRRVTPQIVEIMQVRREDPELARLKMEQFRLGADWIETAAQVRIALRTGQMTREQAVAAFTELAERHFELRQRITRHEIERLRNELAAREQELNADESDRSQWVSRMAERMVERLSGRWGRGPRTEDGDAERDRPRGDRSGDKPW